MDRYTIEQAVRWVGLHQILSGEERWHEEQTAPWEEVERQHGSEQAGYSTDS